MTEHLWDLTANGLARKIADGEVSSLEVIDAHLGRIEEVNGWLNAVTRVLADEARAAAEDADKAVAAGDELGPLHGVPCTIKENIDVAGQRPLRVFQFLLTLFPQSTLLWLNASEGRELSRSVEPTFLSLDSE
tara:strand:+ start:3654 stop:4052 length:399 start_codon:yes stop_codon:yes gene_type:complete